MSNANNDSSENEKIDVQKWRKNMNLWMKEEEKSARGEGGELTCISIIRI